MIVSNLCGGLGNQLFQIAAGYSLAIDNDDEYCINYNLQHHLIQGKPKSEYKDTLYQNIKETDHVPANTYQEPFHHYSPITYQEDLLVNGYLQSPKYFQHNADKIKDLFIFPDEIQSKVRGAFEKLDRDVVGIHIRRGDYLLNPNIHPTCSQAYYRISMKKFPDALFIVCTDTPDWAIENICKDRDDVILSNAKNELEDMYVLSQCNHVIISNSSFAWWGAWLSKNNPTVVAPKIWFGPDGPQDYYDTYVDEWLVE